MYCSVKTTQRVVNEVVTVRGEKVCSSSLSGNAFIPLQQLEPQSKAEFTSDCSEQIARPQCIHELCNESQAYNCSCNLDYSLCVCVCGYRYCNIDTSFAVFKSKAIFRSFTFEFYSACGTIDIISKKYST